MNISILPILYFVGKVVLIEWAIEACRFVVQTIQENRYPENLFLYHPHRILNWSLNILESSMVVVFLYFGVNVYAIILITFLTIMLTKKVGEYLVGAK